MTAAYRNRVERAFGAADEYDRHARVQRRVADALAAHIAEACTVPVGRALEIGCGTGFLTEALVGRGIGSRWLVTDIAPEMVERSRERLGERPGMTFAVLDGEFGIPPEPGFDLICSSLAMQWFDDTPAAALRMREWLAPGGCLVFTTLGGGSFAEWRAAHAREGLSCGALDLPAVETWRRALPEARIDVARYVEHHDNARGFLRALKAIGAGTPARAHRPLTAPQLRRVMANFEAAGCEVTYEVVTCVLEAGDGRAPR